MPDSNSDPDTIVVKRRAIMSSTPTPSPPRPQRTPTTATFEKQLGEAYESIGKTVCEKFAKVSEASRNNFKAAEYWQNVANEKKATIETQRQSFELADKALQEMQEKFEGFKRGEHRSVVLEKERLEIEVERLSEQLSGNSNDVELLHGQMKKDKGEIEELVESNQGLEGRLVEEEGGHAEFRSKTVLALVQGWKLTQLMHRKHGELQSLVDWLREQRDGNIEEAEQREKDHEEQVEALERDAGRLWEEKEATVNDAKEAQDMITAVQAELDRSKERVDALRKEVNKQIDDHQQLVTEHTKLQNSHDELEQNHAKLRSDSDLLRSERDKLKAENDSLQDKYDKLQQDHAKLRSDSDFLRSDRDKLKVDNGCLQDEHDKLKVSHGEVCVALEASRKEIERLQENNNAVETMLREETVTACNGLREKLSETRKALEQSEKGKKQAKEDLVLEKKAVVQGREKQLYERNWAAKYSSKCEILARELKATRRELKKAVRWRGAYRALWQLSLRLSRKPKSGSEGKLGETEMQLGAAEAQCTKREATSVPAKSSTDELGTPDQGNAVSDRRTNNDAAIPTPSTGQQKDNKQAANSEHQFQLPVTPVSPEPELPAQTPQEALLTCHQSAGKDLKGSSNTIASSSREFSGGSRFSSAKPPVSVFPSQIQRAQPSADRPSTSDGRRLSKQIPVPGHAVYPGTDRDRSDPRGKKRKASSRRSRSPPRELRSYGVHYQDDRRRHDGYHRER